MRAVSEESKLISTVGRGLSAGLAVKSLTTVHWNVAGKCERPVYAEAGYGKRPTDMLPWQHSTKVRDEQTPKRVLEVEGRCRQCGPCLRARAAYWRHRAQTELREAGGRTWFVTLTLSPEKHFEMQMRATQRLTRREVGAFEKLDKERQFAERHIEISKELTKFLKRVRKQSGAPLRYLLVAEAHKSGLPHYHALIHEVDPARPVRANVLKEKWQLGFSQCKLVAQGETDHAGAYVAKYLAKSAVSRVRASQGYGQPAASAVSTHSASHDARETLPDTPNQNTRNEVSRERRKALGRSADASPVAEGERTEGSALMGAFNE